MQIQAWLGHTNIAQTSTYLGVSLGATEDAKRLLETADGFAHYSHEHIGTAAEAQANTAVM